MSAKVTRLNIPRKRVARILTRMKKRKSYGPTEPL